MIRVSINTQMNVFYVRKIGPKRQKLMV